MSVRRTKFYLDKSNSKFLGVCSGIADYTGMDVTLVRIITAFGILATSGSVLVAYFIAAWIADKKPNALYDDTADTKAFWQKARAAPSRSIRDTNSSFRDADRRLRDIESYITSNNRGLAAEIDRLK